MKSIPMSSLFALTLLSIFCGCGTSLYINGSYPYSDVQKPSIAVIPAIHEESPSVVDSLFEAAFQGISSRHQISGPLRIRATARTKEEYLALVTKLNSSDADVKDLRAFLTSSELTLLQELAPGARFIFISSNFSLKHVSGSVLGKTTFQLYDISNGALILSDAASFNVMPDGSIRSGGLLSSMSIGTDSDPATERGARSCVVLLANHGAKSLSANFLAKTKSMGQMP